MEGENNFIKPPEQEKKLYKAKIICSCGKLMGEKDGFEQEGLISHSTCEECRVKAKADIEEFKRNNPLK